MPRRPPRSERRSRRLAGAASHSAQTTSRTRVLSSSCRLLGSCGTAGFALIPPSNKESQGVTVAQPRSKSQRELLHSYHVRLKQEQSEQRLMVFKKENHALRRLSPTHWLP